MSSFAKAVRAVVKKIPEGETRTYAQVAKAAGNPKAYRAVGNILNKNTDPNIPCHRVIRSDGTVGGYNRGGIKKGRLIQTELQRSGKMPGYGKSGSKKKKRIVPVRTARTTRIAPRAKRR